MNLIPPINHVIFIPLVLAIGFFMGWRLGTSNVQNMWDRAEAKRREEEEG
ncbi:MAG: hypothetical protein RIT81_43170 [Deltaproteobacteria bacterium]